MVEAQFIKSVLVNHQNITKLEKEVLSSNFINPNYYTIYSEIVTAFLSDKTISLEELKLKLKKDKAACKLLPLIEKEEYIDDINLVFSELLKNTTKERIKGIVGNTLRKCDSEADGEEIKKELEIDLLKLSSISSALSLHSMSDLEGEFVKEIRERQEKFKKNSNILDTIDYPTGFHQLDILTLGFQKQNTWLIAGQTGDGKTQLAVQMVRNIIENNQQALYFLLEDKRQNLLARLCSCHLKIGLSKILTGDLTDNEVKKINNYIAQLRQDNNLFVEDKAMDVNDIIAKLRYAKIKYPNLTLAFVDHIHKSHDSLYRSVNREQELSSITRKLYAAAKELDMCIVLLGQLNTAPDTRTSGMPVQLNDLRDSKSSTFDAAVCLYLYFPYKSKQDHRGMYSKEYLQLLLLKNRYGIPNKILDFHNKAHIARFDEGKPEVYRGTDEEDI